LSRSTLAALLAIRLDESPLSDVLDRLVRIACDALKGADEVSITLVRGETPFTAAYTGQLALDADEMQYARGYGPCIDAGTTGTLLRVVDMRAETRWPDYAATVVSRGVLSSLSVPLPIQEGVIGALNVYARKPDAFTEEDIAAADAFAAYAATAVANANTVVSTAELAEQMRAAMASRVEIEQAKGVLMAREGVTPDQAFDILVRASQRENRKLRDLAQEIVQRAQRRA